MRAVARIAAEATPENDDAGLQTLEAKSLVEAWLRKKGATELRDGEVFLLAGGRNGILATTRLDNGTSQLLTWTLTESTGSGTFETQMTVGHDGKSVAMMCQLRAGTAAGAVSPIAFEVRTPSVLVDILRIGTDWRFGQEPIGTRVVRFVGTVGGERLAELLTSLERSLPVVLISEQHGLQLHPTLADRLRHDLTGLATVASLDDTAAWALTTAIGQRFSCFGGAVRLYWPGVDPATSQPLSHPLWTVTRLLDGVSGTSEAAERICRTIRRRVHGISALTVQPPELLVRLQEADRAARFAEARKYLSDADDYRQLAESYFDENRALHTKVQELEGELRDTRTQLRHLQETLMYWQPTSHDDVLPEESSATSPEMVADAVARAQAKHGDVLAFGSDVAEGVRGLNPLAGPPSRVLQHLEALAELSHLRRSGSLGTSPREWLRPRA